MHADIETRPEAMGALCRHFGVMRLEVFGSGARGDDFDPTRSDADFLVEFRPDSELSPLRQFFGLARALESLLGRQVDLVERGAVRNPFVLAAINQAREVVYGA